MTVPPPGSPSEPRTPAIRVFTQWVLFGALIGVACGVASALFLWLLDRVTQARTQHSGIVYALPLAGVAMGLVYERWGASIRGGNNLVIDSLHENQAPIPLRMAPMVLVGTLVTHLFGGSAGREGTAVQMGASLAEEIARRGRVASPVRRHLLAAGMAGGFASVFGTPMAGLMFGMEVVCIGRLDFMAFVPALLAAVIGDQVTRALGIHHTVYPAARAMDFSLTLLGKLLLMGAAMALVAVVFIDLTHTFKATLERRMPRLPWRMGAGGLLLIGLWRLAGSDAYLGLGLPTLVRAFSDPALPDTAFAAKLVFTSVTLGCGFLGGEVTPLFFIGATLGNLLARFFHLPIPLGAGLGLAAVFGAAANTPLALSIMAMELLGTALFPHVFIVTLTAYLLTGHRGIYPSQRLGRRKYGWRRLEPPLALRDVRNSSRRPGGPTKDSLGEP